MDKDCKAGRVMSSQMPKINSHALTHLLDGHVKVRLESHGGLEPLSIFLYEVEVNCTHQLLVLIQYIRLHTSNTTADINHRLASTKLGEGTMSINDYCEILREK